MSGDYFSPQGLKEVTEKKRRRKKKTDDIQENDSLLNLDTSFLLLANIPSLVKNKKVKKKNKVNAQDKKITNIIKEGSETKSNVEMKKENVSELKNDNYEKVIEGTLTGFNKPVSKKNKKKKKNIERIKAEKLTDSIDVQNPFKFKDIIQNRKSSNLIHELISCFINTMNLPKNDGMMLYQSLFQKTVKLIVCILNKCVNKIALRILSEENFIKEVKRRNMKDACVQTDFTAEPIFTGQLLH